MISHTFHRMEPRTVIDIWWPRYSDRWQTGEKVALLAKFKVDNAAPWIIVNFTKAHDLKDQRFAITRGDAKQYPLENNGSIPCYAIPLSKFVYWDTDAEIVSKIKSFGWI